MDYQLIYLQILITSAQKYITRQHQHQCMMHYSLFLNLLMPTFRAPFNTLKDRRGQALVEIFVSLGLLIIGALAMSSFSANIGLLKKYGPDQTRAVFLAEEGLEAMRSLRDRDFLLLSDGTHGIALNQNGRWDLSGASDTESEFTRTVTIATTAPRLKQITSSVTGPRTSITLTTALADLRQNSGMTKGLSFDLSEARLDDGNSALRGIKITNIGPSSITITNITAWWGENTSLMQSVDMGNTVWSHNAIGTPSGRQPSGTLLDIADVTLASGQSEDNTKFDFKGSVSTVMVQFRLMDGTSAYVTIQPQS